MVIHSKLSRNVSIPINFREYEKREKPSDKARRLTFSKYCEWEPIETPGIKDYPTDWTPIPMRKFRRPVKRLIAAPDKFPTYSGLELPEMARLEEVRKKRQGLLITLKDKWKTARGKHRRISRKKIKKFYQTLKG